MIGQDYKQRIEEIRRGEVPDGYTHTRVGVIPMDWQETRIIDRFDRVTRKNDENNKNVLTISAQQGLISQGDYYEKEIASEDKSTYYLLRKGDFAYNKSYSSGYPYGAIKRLEAFEKGIVSPLYICFAPKKETDSDFYRFYFDSGLFNREIYRIAQEGARNHGLLNVATEDFFGATLIDLPKDEQKKIAQILDACDRVIELKQKLVDELKKLKKACLAKMFPQEGETVPEIRFPGFTAPWERCKLSTIADIVTGTTPPTKDIDNYGGDKLFISPADIREDRYVANTTTTLTEKGYILGRKLRGGTSLFVSIGSSIGKVAQIKDFATTNQQINAVVPHDVMADDFVFTMLENEADSIKKLTTMQAVPIINKATFGAIEIKHPQKNEQRKIGDLFSILDSLITFHQHELEEEQKKKKALMQLLLTGIVRVRI